MRDPRETLEEMTRIFDELRDRPEKQVILVEGMKDRTALNLLGVAGEIWQVQGPNSVFSTTERLAKEGKDAIILTDWDRKGGHIARLLRQGFIANAVRHDSTYRLRLAQLAKKEIKDIESLPAFFTRLVSMVENSAYN